MKKSILVLAAVAAVATLAQAPAAEARGLRIGFGFGVPFGGRVGMADPSILRRAQDANERVQAREREVIHGRRAVAVARPSIRHEQAAQAREAKRQEAAAAAEAKRQARVAAAAAAKVETANSKKKNVQVAKPAVAPASAPIVVAAPAAVVPTAAISGDRQLDAAQQRQNAKADEVLKTLAKPTAAPAATVPSAAPVVRQSGSDASPFDTGAAVAPVAPATVKSVVPAAATAPAKEASAGECLRFVPGAGVTIKVSCSE